MQASLIFCLLCQRHGRTARFKACGEGNFVVDAQWAQGKLMHAQVLSRAGGFCQIRIPGQKASEFNLQQGDRLVYSVKSGWAIAPRSTAQA